MQRPHYVVSAEPGNHWVLTSDQRLTLARARSAIRWQNDPPHKWTVCHFDPTDDTFVAVIGQHDAGTRYTCDRGPLTIKAWAEHLAAIRAEALAELCAAVDEIGEPPLCLCGHHYVGAPCPQDTMEP
ncbi:hypothetical protein Kuura_056 [Caulobacter phage Kuura]|nr:hypothetical protein Kuura_056 [Caulobacter phage Kuura]